MLDRDTLAAYEAGAAAYAARGVIAAGARAVALREAALDDGPIVDLGCGTGNDLAYLGPSVIGVDPSTAMLAEARHVHPAAALVRATAGALPLRPGSLGGAWAAKSLQHVAAPHLPLALADLHRSLAVGAPVALRAFAGEGVQVTSDRSDLPGRRFTFWAPDALAEVVEGAGFVDLTVALDPGDDDRWAYLDLIATRGRTLADTVGPGMRLLVSGLNPSLTAADAGFGYAGATNRFWSALAEAGLCPAGADRDPWRLLADGGIGMTDVVKRATPRASELTTAEYRAGIARLDRLCGLLSPAAVVLVGLAGWRAGADRKAVAGWQQRRLGPSPVYVMPSTSGLNAATPRATLVEHLRAAAAGAPPS